MNYYNYLILCQIINILFGLITSVYSVTNKELFGDIYSKVFLAIGIILVYNAMATIYFIYIKLSHSLLPIQESDELLKLNSTDRRPLVILDRTGVFVRRENSVFIPIQNNPKYTNNANKRD